MPSSQGDDDAGFSSHGKFLRGCYPKVSTDNPQQSCAVASPPDEARDPAFGRKAEHLPGQIQPDEPHPWIVSDQFDRFAVPCMQGASVRDRVAHENGTCCVGAEAAAARVNLKALPPVLLARGVGRDQRVLIASDGRNDSAVSGDFPAGLANRGCLAGTRSCSDPGDQNLNPDPGKNVPRHGG